MEDKTLLFLCSGGGGNLRFIHQAIQRGWLPGWQHIVVITDRECSASYYARQQGLPLSCINLKNDGQAALLDIALLHKPDVVITTIHKILDEAFVDAFDGKMLNIHYSLLPSFAGSIGANPVKAAINYGACLGGATVHWTTKEVDAGRPIAQIAFPLVPDDDIEKVMDIEFRIGCIALLSALRIFDGQAIPDWHGGVIQVKCRNVLLNPALALPAELFEEAFWSLFK